MANATKTTQTSTAAAEQPKRISCGSVWSTSNDKFMAGNLRPATKQYANQQQLLDLLPEAPAGFAWRVKAYKSRSQSESAPEWDLSLELEPLKQR